MAHPYEALARGPQMRRRNQFGEMLGVPPLPDYATQRPTVPPRDYVTMRGQSGASRIPGPQQVRPGYGALSGMAAGMADSLGIGAQGVRPGRAAAPQAPVAPAAGQMANRGAGMFSRVGSEAARLAGAAPERMANLWSAFNEQFPVAGPDGVQAGPPMRGLNRTSPGIAAGNLADSLALNPFQVSDAVRDQAEKQRQMAAFQNAYGGQLVNLLADRQMRGEMQQEDLASIQAGGNPAAARLGMSTAGLLGNPRQATPSPLHGIDTQERISGAFAARQAEQAMRDRAAVEARQQSRAERRAEFDAANPVNLVEGERERGPMADEIRERRWNKSEATRLVEGVGEYGLQRRLGDERFDRFQQAREARQARREMARQRAFARRQLPDQMRDRAAFTEDGQLDRPGTMQNLAMAGVATPQMMQAMGLENQRADQERTAAMRQAEMEQRHKLEMLPHDPDHAREMFYARQGMEMPQPGEEEFDAAGALSDAMTVDGLLASNPDLTVEEIDSQIETVLRAAQQNPENVDDLMKTGRLSTTLVKDRLRQLQSERSRLSSLGSKSAMMQGEGTPAEVHDRKVDIEKKISELNLLLTLADEDHTPSAAPITTGRRPGFGRAIWDLSVPSSPWSMTPGGWAADLIRSMRE